MDKALRILRQELGDRTALIGFAGSPWTLATFMMEGGSAEKYTHALQLFRKEPKIFSALLEKLTAAVTAYLEMQIEAGADALQIFDSHGGLLAPTEFHEASGRWMQEIIAKLGRRVPVIVFSLGTHGNWDDLIATGANVLGIDWRFSLADARRLLPAGIGLQGNLAPAFLSDATPEATAAETNAAFGGNARAEGLYFQPRPRRAAGCQAGKYRRSGRDCEKSPMKNSTQRRNDATTRSLTRTDFATSRLCYFAPLR